MTVGPLPSDQVASSSAPNVKLAKEQDEVKAQLVKLAPAWAELRKALNELNRVLQDSGVVSGRGGQGVSQLGVVSDDRAATRLKVFAAGGKGGVGVEQHEGVPRERATGVVGVVAVAEPPADFQVGVVQLSDPGVGQDALGIAAALAVALDRLPDSQHTKIGVRLRFEDVVGDPPGPPKTGASSGRHQQHETAMTRPAVECFGEGGQRARLRP